MIVKENGCADEVLPVQEYCDHDALGTRLA
jgi:hypothetical protein